HPADVMNCCLACTPGYYSLGLAAGIGRLSYYDLDLAKYRKLVSLIYGAVLDQSRWEDFLVELTQAAGGVKTHLFGFDIPAGISLGLTSAGYDPDYLETYDTHFGTMNAWA